MAATKGVITHTPQQLNASLGWLMHGQPAPVAPPPPPLPPPPPPSPPVAQRGLMAALARYAPYARVAGRVLAPPMVAYDAYQAITDPSMVNRAMAVGGLGLAAAPFIVPELAIPAGLIGAGLNAAQIPGMREDLARLGGGLKDALFPEPPPTPAPKPRSAPDTSRYAQQPELMP